MPNNSNNGGGASPRDPLRLIRGDPRLDAVWRDALTGSSSPEGRAALIHHYRAEREKFLKKETTRDEK